MSSRFLRSKKCLELVIGSEERVEDHEQRVLDTIENTWGKDFLDDFFEEVDNSDNFVQHMELIVNFEELEEIDMFESSIITLDILSNILDRVIPDLDYSAESSDEYIPNSDSESDAYELPHKKKNYNTRQRPPLPSLIIPESDSEVDEVATSFWEREGIINGRKRKPRKSTKERRSVRENRKIKRNSGHEYATSKGKIVSARAPKELGLCRKQCATRIPEMFRKEVFSFYWTLNDYEKRCQFLANCIELGKKKTSKIQTKGSIIRENAHNYVLRYDHAEYSTCKGCLMKILGETNKFFQSTIDKKVIGKGVIPNSTRGRKTSYSAITNDRLEEVKSHILSFPSYESHYGRSKTTKIFLPSDLNVTIMYDLYKGKTQNPVSKTVYTTVFRAQNLSFKRPHVDTCLKCDTLNAKIKCASGQVLDELVTELRIHQDQAAEMYDVKTADKELAKQSDNLLVLSFDLQQCLPTPCLKTGAVFYKRQLWTYNLTIYDCAANTCTCYMWHEAIANRGGNEVASCLYHFLQNKVSTEIKHVILFSDSCAGQNKNKHIIAMLMTVCKLSPHIETIEHKFMVPGHTHMECDVVHSLIEKGKKKTSMNIHQPRDWYQLVRSVSKKDSISVYELDQEDIYDFESLYKGPFTARTIDEEKEKFLLSQCNAFKYQKDFTPRFLAKSAVSEYKTINFGRKKKKNSPDQDFDFSELKRCYDEALPISLEKKRDLMSMFDLIDPSAKQFFEQITSKEDVPNIDPDLEFNQILEHFD